MTSATPSHCRVTTGARLHFGLIDVTPPFGGCGVMIDVPATVIEASPARRFVIKGMDDRASLHSRVLAIADRIVHRRGLEDRPAVEVNLVDAAPSHHGLGSGTQFNLAVAEAMLACLANDPNSGAGVGDGVREVDRHDVMAVAARGRRSAVGTHGYFHGGFLVEGIESNAEVPDVINDLDGLHAMPEPWHVVVCLPDAGDVAEAATTVSGANEQRKFDTLAKVTLSQRQRLTCLLQREMVPAITDGDFDRFAAAVSQYNHDSGMLFAAVQGGPYNGPAVGTLVDELRSRGHDGVGQSSWGPGVFVWSAHADEAHRLADEIVNDGPAVKAWVAPVRNQPRTCVVRPG